VPLSQLFNFNFFSVLIDAGLIPIQDSLIKAHSQFFNAKTSDQAVVDPILATRNLILQLAIGIAWFSSKIVATSHVLGTFLLGNKQLYNRLFAVSNDNQNRTLDNSVEVIVAVCSLVLAMFFNRTGGFLIASYGIASSFTKLADVSALRGANSAGNGHQKQ